MTHWRQQEGNGVIKNESDKESTDLVIRNAHLPSRVSTEETNRDGIKVSVKLFAYNESCKVFTNAINFVMDELAIDVIDSLTLSLPPSLTKGSIELIKPIWSCAVKNVRLGKVKDVGVSDLNTDQLKELYTWAEEIKPSTNQINLDACCVIPPEMNEFAQSKDIRLLTHNDPRGKNFRNDCAMPYSMTNHSFNTLTDFVPLDKLQTLLGEAGFENPEAWQRLWVARYTVMVTGKGIIQTKGYILGLVKAGE